MNLFAENNMQVGKITRSRVGTGRGQHRELNGRTRDGTLTWKP